ncbi:iron donor protein CyaY [Candidatus Enterovibrio escicola]|uniref:Iron-sulfur cluster assembly protein CyaY n=1 Tax=Candidatus Enterovibrio escicola TaxID=1927127 RepID=A0A2A5SZ40_9GAMM|nr:iron donor protein CyaY [Candidatus Enterovibrio escacola]PCS21177.1 Frataxin-like protein CyaY, facilitates iron supply for heme A synthesis or Fe-S cluster assembly [Candidatus Enterovibrio escacola]
MNASQYHELVDAQWIMIEEGINDRCECIDYEITGNVMTLEFENCSQIIINRQESVSEIWLASKSGGFHFSYKGDKWLCNKTGMEFIDLVKQECSKHSGRTIDW